MIINKKVDLFSGEILYIHPSILPSLKGLNTHYRALKKGIHVHGATVHKVTEILDSGIKYEEVIIPIQLPEGFSEEAIRA